MRKILIIITLIQLLLISAWIASSNKDALGAIIAIQVPQGGTGSTTLSGILMGNGINQIKTTIIGSGLSFDGTTLSSTGSGTNYLTSSSTNTYLNTGTNLQSPTFEATSTTATSTFPNLSSSLFYGTFPVTTTAGKSFSTTHSVLGALDNGLARIIKTRPRTTSKRIVIIGSSTAAGTGASTYSNSWAGRLANALATSSYEVFNVAYSSDTSTNNVARFYTDVAPLQPDFVILANSINNDGLYSNPTTGYATYMSAVRQLIKLTESIDAVPIVIGQFGNNNSTAETYRVVKDIYDQLEHEGIYVWDFLNPTADPDNNGQWYTGMNYDTLHPNDIGHKAMFDAIPYSFFDTVNTKRLFINDSAHAWTWGANTTNTPFKLTLATTSPSWTVGAWIKDGDTSAKTYLHLTGDSNAPRLRNAVDTYDFYSTTTHASSSVVTNSSWHHIAITYNKPMGRLSLYIDGALQSSNALVSFSDVTGASWLGRDGSSATNAVGASLAHPFFYRSPLNADDIKDLYQGRIPTKSLEFYSSLDQVGQFPRNQAETTSSVKATYTSFTDAGQFTFTGNVLANDVKLTTGNLVIGTSTSFARLFVQASGNTNGRLFEALSSASTTLSLLSDNGTMYFANNVGVGTSSPYAKLSVVGDVVAASFLATSSTSTFNGLKLTGVNCSSLSNGGALTVNANGEIVCSADDGGSGSGDANEKWATSTDPTAIYPNGATKVGIGTSSPISSLHVEGTNSSTGGITISSSAGTTNNRFAIFPNGNFSTEFKKLSAGSLLFTSSTGVNEFTILSSGLVGIGTSSPYSKLSVAGKVVAESFTSTSTTEINTFPIASTTALSVSGNSWLGTILSGTWNGAAIDFSTYVNATAGTGIQFTNDDIGFDCSEVEGTGINCATEAITLDATGDWTGTIDGNNFAGGAIDAGQLIYGGGAGSFSELSIGASSTILTTDGTSPRWLAGSTLCVAITGSADLCDGADASGGTGTVYLASTTPWTAGQIASVVNNGTLTSVATGTLTEGVTGLEFSATGNLVGSAAVLNLTSGYSMFLTASGTNWNSFYDTPSNRITAGNGLTWSTNTINFDGGDTPAGELGGTWASPTLNSEVYSIQELSDVTDAITETFGDLLYWNGTLWADIATSSLNISTTNTTEGTNLYYTDLRVGAYIVGSTSLTIATTTANGSITVNGGATSTFPRLSVTTAFNFLGDYITNTTTWFLTKLQAVSAFVAAVSSTWDFGGAASVEIPNGTGNTVDATGECAWDTTDDQLVCGDSGNTARVVAHDEFQILNATFASTSYAFISGTNLQIGSNKDGIEITQIRCNVTNGTSYSITLTDGTNATESTTCNTTVSSDTDVATNDTFTADEMMYLDFGTKSGTVDYLHVQVWGRIVRE